ncbi:uncharacterized protein LOC128179440 isoform X3 [Crassostrea angulata]|uniref:uncharacterized protein LOC128179440 isoform X3 n=1 Tax=Magallana angulata TaxID=2784310 RepID=UPI0022B0DBC9|nr:uncharacterized protein LOC128179440 isoform X3 [Crassostrea angulata]
MDKKTFASLKSLCSPPKVVVDVMKAFLLLVYQSEDVKDWKSCQKKMADPNLMTKMEHFDPLYCTESIAQKADDLIAKETVDTVRNYSLDAGQVYKWTKAMIDQVKSSGGLKA